MASIYSQLFKALETGEAVTVKIDARSYGTMRRRIFEYNSNANAEFHMLECPELCRAVRESYNAETQTASIQLIPQAESKQTTAKANFQILTIGKENAQVSSNLGTSEEE